MPEHPVTPAQLKFLGILFDDCGFTIASKKDFLMRRFKVRFFDELTLSQASTLIAEMKAHKETQKELERLTPEEGED